MARTSRRGGVNKSQAIRDVLAKSPDMKVSDIVALLVSQGVDAKSNLVYLIKGKVKGEKGRRGRIHQNAASTATAAGSTDALGTILKVKKLAVDVGGLRALKELVDALSE